MTAKYFELGYYCINGGDGSAGVDFRSSRQDAVDAEEADSEEEYYEGWGEPSASSVRLKIENGILYFYGDTGWNEVMQTGEK